VDALGSDWVATGLGLPENLPLNQFSGGVRVVRIGNQADVVKRKPTFMFDEEP
jgi:hypothetical protein